MSDPTAPKLKLKDIKFLRAIRDINQSPDEYRLTERGKVPATVGAIKDATDLSDGDVNYRAQPSRSRLKERGYIEIHEAQLTENGYGPKSFELTPEGEQALKEAMVAHGLTDADTADLRDSQQLEQVSAQTANLADRVESLETRLEELTGKVTQLQEVLERYEEAPTGAMDSSERDKLEALIGAMPAHDTALRALGVNLSEIQNTGDVDPEAIRDQVRSELLAGSGQSGGHQSDGVSDTDAEAADPDQADLNSIEGG